MVREYELGLVLNPELSDEQMEAQLLRLGQQIETRKGEVTRLDKWGRRRLAYPIRHHRDGYYVFLEFRIDSAELRDLERSVQVQESIMRHLMTWRDPRAQAERRRREQEAAIRAAAQAAQVAQAAEHHAAQAAQRQADEALRLANEAAAEPSVSPVSATPAAEPDVTPAPTATVEAPSVAPAPAPAVESSAVPTPALESSITPDRVPTPEPSATTESTPAAKEATPATEGEPTPVE